MGRLCVHAFFLATCNKVYQEVESPSKLYDLCVRSVLHQLCNACSLRQAYRRSHHYRLLPGTAAMCTTSYNTTVHCSTADHLLNWAYGSLFSFNFYYA